MANSSTMSQSRRRPKRQRTPTTIYTDDNPTTFTTKIKKGQNNGQQENDGEFSPRSSTDSSAFSALEESKSMPPPEPVVKRGPGRPPRRKSAEQVMSVPGGKTRASTTAHTSTNKNVRSDSGRSVSPSYISTKTVSEEQTNQVVTKRKRGRPPKNRPKELPVISDSTLESDHSDTKSNTKTLSQGETKTERTKFALIKKILEGGSICTETNNRQPFQKTTATGKAYDKGRSRTSLDSMEKKDLDGSVDGKVSSTIASNRNLNGQRRTKFAKSPFLFRAQANSSASWTPPQRDIEATFVNHSVTIAPLFPPVSINDNGSIFNMKDKLTNSEGSNNDSANSDMTIQLKSKYPVVFDEGVPKTSSSIAPPFSSTSKISSALSSNTSKHKLNQPQHHLSLPTWSPLYDPPVFFEDDYDRESGHLDISNTIPVTRHITAMAVRKPHHDYLVLGDSVGFVTIYSLGKDNINIPVAQLESVACLQRGKVEQDRLRADLLKKMEKGKGSGKSLSGTSKSSSRKFLNSSGPSLNTIGAQMGTANETNSIFASKPQHVRSILLDTSDTTIHALGMIENRVVLATTEELECMDVPSGTSLWVCPLSSNRFVTSLDMHLNTYDVLVSCSKTLDSTDIVSAPISPLMLLQHSKNNVEICDANSPMLVRSPSCTAIWDIGARNRLLFITLSSNRQEHELVLVSGGSIDSWKVACKTKIPAKTSSATSGGTPTKLSQSPGGIYTLVASSRGIRLYQTESLQLIHIYGDQLALHGQSVVWKDCWLAGSYFSKDEKYTKAAKGLPQQWLQCDNLLGERIKKRNKSKNSIINDDSYKDQNAPNLAPYLIGVPHTKGPEELCEKLHVWKVEHPSVVPMMSISLPPKSEGALGLIGSGNSSNSYNTAVTEDRLILVTNDGKGHFMSPKMESNFAGISYPPGYQVVTDNIEYIEDEDATDNVASIDSNVKNDGSDEFEDTDVDLLGHGEDDESMDEELREAMRQSLLEHKKHETALKDDEVVDILDSDEVEHQEFLPCRPEPYLRQMINSHDGEGTSGSESEEDRSSEILGSNGKGESGSSNLEAHKPKVTSATFISNFLDLIPTKPTMPKPKPLEEDCLSFTKTKVVVAVNPIVPVRAGRGKKSRAANLETMLKASVNPYLQSLMLSRQGVPVNGQGSRLRVRKTAAGKCTSILPDERSMKLKPHSRDLSGVTRSTLDSVTEIVNEESYSGSNSSDAAVSMKPSSYPRQTTNSDEAAVVMGLLGLSPCHTTNVASNSCVPSNSKDEDSGVNAANGRSKGSPYLNSSSLALVGVKNGKNQDVSATSSDRESVVEGSEIVGKKRVSATASCNACRGRHVIHTCGKRALPIDYEEIARKEKEKKEKEEEEKKRVRAEKRRLADQKRREAKKQKQRELEEQRTREENKRLEDEKQRHLQENFASQDLTQQRREQIVASYTNHTSIDNRQMHTSNENNSVECTRSQSVHPNFSMYSNETSENLTDRSIENSDRTAVLQVTHSFSQPPQRQESAPVSTVGVQYSQQPFSTSEEKIVHETERVHTQGNGSGFSISSKSSRHVDNSELSQSPLAQAALLSLSAKLASADALIALASMAQYAKALPDTENHSAECTASSIAPECSSYASYRESTLPDLNTRESTTNNKNFQVYAPSHGFGINTSAANDYSSEMKRGIPSYATIRAQHNNGSESDVAPPMANTLTSGASFSNGFANPTSDSNVYSCPSHPDDQNSS